MTFLAEIGDKTFIMIMIFVPKMSNVILFVASSLSLAMMHTLGALFGKQTFIVRRTFPIVYRPTDFSDHFMSGVLFLWHTSHLLG